MDMTHPNQSMTQPNQGMAHPNQGMAQPNQDMTQPNQGMTQPNQDMTQPNHGMTQSNQGIVQPNQDMTEPNHGMTQPDENIAEDMKPNPWQVDFLRAFLYLKCPECVFDTQTTDEFREHALKNHPLSFELIGKTSLENPFEPTHSNHDIKIKQEPGTNSYFEQDYYYGDQGYGHYEHPYIHEGPTNNDVKKEQHICTFCEAIFARSYELKRHVDSVHENKRPYKCPECDQSFKVKHHLKRHFGRAHKDKEYPYIKQEPKEMTYEQYSEQFDNQFDYSSYLETNIDDGENDVKPGEHFMDNKEKKPKKEGEEKRYSCKLCGITFSRTNSLKRHVLSIHEQRRPYACPQCPQKFKIKYHLQKHVERAHEGKKAPRCEICSSRFKKDEDLLFHMTLHEGKDPLQCPFCDTHFEKKNSMTFHIGTVHEGKTPHPCHICDLKFTEFNVLKNHLGTTIHK